MILFFAIPQHRLNRHRAVHQADAGVGGMAVYAYESNEASCLVYYIETLYNLLKIIRILFFLAFSVTHSNIYFFAII